MNTKKTAKVRVLAGMAVWACGGAWAVMPSAGEPVVQARPGGAGAAAQGAAGTKSSQTDTLIHLHRAVTGSLPPMPVVVDTAVRCCEANRATR